MDRHLEGKVAIVTGGGTGIGASIAQRFAREGAAVAICGRRPEPLASVVGAIEAEGGKAIAVACDSATEEGVEQLFREVENKFGPVDILVNNAGVAGPFAPIWEQELAGWEDTLRINLTGPFLCSRAAARSMKERQSGVIVNIGSMSGKKPLATRTPYTSSKLGLVGLTRTMALELGEFGINVNCISPGAVNTSRLQELADKWGITLQQIKDGASAGSALRRVSEPEDIASAALFLASPEAKNITGFDLTVDAGMWYS
jgi:NAD(P)-dependent dehydrogenase (short-subunit alcohol dehydrogenase family)